METVKIDIIERLDDPEMYVDAIDDAIREIKLLRELVEQLNQIINETSLAIQSHE